MNKKAEELFLSTYDIHDYDVPLTTVDMAIFAIIDSQLHVLLVKRTDLPALGQWALPGGFIHLKEDENIDSAAFRKLKEKTGVTSPYLEQVCSIGNQSRDPRGWAVTILYFALINYLEVNSINTENEGIKWIPLEDANKTKLAFDHNELLSAAASRLQSKTRYTALPVSLMPDLFTLTELQTIFEIILGVTLQKKAFRKRILDAKAVRETKSNKISGKRPAKLYGANSLPRDFEFPRAIEIGSN